MGTLLVHVVGESDLHLSSRPPPGDDRVAWGAARPARVQSRLAQVWALLAQGGSPSTDLARLLTDGGWGDDAESTDGSVGLVAALGAAGAGAECDIDVGLVGTEQPSPDSLDTLRLIQRAITRSTRNEVRRRQRSLSGTSQAGAGGR
jgi:hypothetical protein